MFQQESPPAWTQEAYRPPCSEYSFCCPDRVPPPGGVPGPDRVPPPGGVPGPGPDRVPPPGGVPGPGPDRVPPPGGGTWTWPGTPRRGYLDLDLTGYPPGGVPGPGPDQVPPPGGYPDLDLTGYPPRGGTRTLTWLGTPRGGTRTWTWPGTPPPPGGYPDLDLTGYPPGGVPGPDWVPPPPGGYPDPPRCLMAFWEMLQSIMGYGYPPPGVDRQTKWNYYLPVVLRTRAVINLLFPLPQPPASEPQKRSK